MVVWLCVGDLRCGEAGCVNEWLATLSGVWLSVWRRLRCDEDNWMAVWLCVVGLEVWQDWLCE